MSDIKILLVEDEQIVAKFTEKQLTSAGYKILASVTSGELAIEQLNNKLTPDIILMDIKLVGSMDGIETADHIRINPCTALRALGFRMARIRLYPVPYECRSLSNASTAGRQIPVETKVRRRK